MGTVTLPNEATTGCSFCFFPGGPHGGIQPKYIDLEFIGTKAGQVFNPDVNFIPTGPYRLQQVAGCAYRLVTGSFNLRFEWGSVRTFCGLLQAFGEEDEFHSIIGLVCATDYVPVNQSFTARIVWGGSIKITWPLGGL